MTWNDAPAAKTDTDFVKHPMEGWITDWEYVDLGENFKPGREKVRLMVDTDKGQRQANFMIGTYGWTSETIEVDGVEKTLWSPAPYKEYNSLKAAAEKAGVFIIEDIEVRDKEEIKEREPVIIINDLALRKGSEELEGKYIVLKVKEYIPKNSDKKWYDYVVEYLGKNKPGTKEQGTLDQKYSAPVDPKNREDQQAATKPNRPAERAGQPPAGNGTRRGRKEAAKPAANDEAPKTTEEKAEDALDISLAAYDEFIEYIKYVMNLNETETVSLKALKTNLSGFKGFSAGKRFFVDSHPETAVTEVGMFVDSMIEAGMLRATANGTIAIVDQA
jgi:hypothetical protein